MKYAVVEKDVENRIGFLHNKIYTNKKEANKWVKILKESLGTEYYDIFVVEVAEE
jgi:hypothetical protein